jgi:hypothetical protein
MAQAVTYHQCTGNGGYVEGTGAETGWTCRGGMYDGRAVTMTIWRRWGLAPSDLMRRVTGRQAK